MSKEQPQLYEVWRLSFEYEDQPGVSKERPVIVGAVDEEFAAILAIKVTGHGPRPEFAGEVRILDWQEAGLSKPSVARCSKTLIVPIEAFDGQLKYGRLTERDSRSVSQALRDLGVTI